MSNFLLFLTNEKFVFVIYKKGLNSKQTHVHRLDDLQTGKLKAVIFLVYIVFKIPIFATNRKQISYLSTRS